MQSNSFGEAKVYLVGGACRDILMGVEPKDMDFVVVGSSPEEMFNTVIGGDSNERNRTMERG